MGSFLSGNLSKNQEFEPPITETPKFKAKPITIPVSDVPNLPKPPLPKKLRTYKNLDSKSDNRLPERDGLFEPEDPYERRNSL